MIRLPTIPQTIVVHLGAPDAPAENISIPFDDYIKNVASSEIYPTWPTEAIRANVLAQISVALNRVYTEHYRSDGYPFDITSSYLYDQTFINGRDIFENVSAVVDDLFTSYIRKSGSIEPLYARFCDGVQSRCDGLSQWGTVERAEAGESALEILRYYYGSDIELVENTPIENAPLSVPEITLREGIFGAEVELIQRRLNRISLNFPGIPKISPTDGFFNKSTTDAVRTFQEVFGLVPDGLVGRDTWYNIQSVYFAVKRLADINSEGLRIDELSTQYGSALSEGDISAAVAVIQYYLAYIAVYLSTVPAIAVDGIFGPATKNAVLAFQESYGIPANGIVDRQTFQTMQNVYYGMVEGIPFSYQPGRVLPYPGRILYLGSEGNDVRTFQEYLAFIAKTYTSIPAITPDGVFGPATEAATNAFTSLFSLPPNGGRVGILVWNAAARIYEDLYEGTMIHPGQFPGYDIS